MASQADVRGSSPRSVMGAPRPPARERQLRVAFVDYWLDPARPGRSGLSDIVWDMASALVDSGHEAHIVAAYRSAEVPDRRVKLHSFTPPPLGYRNVVGHTWLLKRAADVLRALRPDVIHSPEYYSTAVLATYGVPAPLVFTVPGNIYHRLRHEHSYEWYYVQLLKWAAHTAARRGSVVAVSREMQRWWQLTGSRPEHTHWIPYGVNPERFRPVPAARECLGLPSDQLTLLYVGRFAPEKGLLDLLAALSRLRGQIAPGDLRVILVGAGPQADELAHAIARGRLEPFVELRPWVAQSELSTWYSAADALLLPSHSEAFARVILEALSCGTPVIGSRITGTEDHIVPETSGFTYMPGADRELAALLALVAQRPELLRRLRTSARAYVERELTWERITQRIVREVYYPLLNARAATVGPAEPALL